MLDKKIIVKKGFQKYFHTKSAYYSIFLKTFCENYINNET